MELETIRPDLLFSNWIVVWTLIFLCGRWWLPWIRDFGNPVLAIWLSLFESMATFLALAFFAQGPRTKPISPETYRTILAKYAFVTIVLKGIPLYLLREWPIRLAHDSVILVVLLSLYVLYCDAMGTSVFEIYRKTYEWIRNGENRTPMFMVLAYLGWK